MQHIETVTLSASQSSITFSAIPQDFTDLVVLVSARSDRATAFEELDMALNGTTITSGVQLFAESSGVGSATNNFTGGIPANSTTANTFSNISIYLSNYTSSNNKSVSADGVSEDNGTLILLSLSALLSTVTSSITSVGLITANSTNLLSGSTFSLYGITAGSDGTTTVS